MRKQLSGILFLVQGNLVMKKLPTADAAGSFTERLKKESSLETEAFLGVGPHEVAVEAGDVVHADAFRAGRLHIHTGSCSCQSLPLPSASSWYQDALGTFRLALRQQIEMGDLGGGEQHGGSVFTGGHACAAADAGMAASKAASAFTFPRRCCWRSARNRYARQYSLQRR